LPLGDDVRAELVISRSRGGFDDRSLPQPVSAVKSGVAASATIRVAPPAVAFKMRFFMRLSGRGAGDGMTIAGVLTRSDLRPPLD
jgi:hypothetical protein